MSLLDTNTDLIAGTVGNTTISGSNISSNEGDINIESKNNTVINASKDTYNSSTITKAWESNITLGSTAGSGIAATLDNAINALQVSLSMSLNRSKSDTTSTTYHNSQLTAQNGNINVTSNGTTSSGSQTGGDTTISGGNILGQDVNITSNGNLTVESLQNSYIDKSKSFGLSLGGGTSNASGGINYSSNKTDRLWTDNQTSILGTNSVTINTTNNTEITGAVIANSTNGAIGENAIDGGNLTLNTKTLTFKNLEDHYLTENFGAGFSTSIGTGLNSNTNNQANPNPMQNLNFYPSGSTTLSLQNGSTKKEQTTFATFGNGTLKITDNSDTSTLNRDVTKTQIVTLDQITGALDVNTTLDNRLFTADGRNQVENEQKNLGSNLLTATEAQNELLLGVLPTPKTEGGLIGQIISMVAGDQRKLAVEMDETTKIKIAEANQKKEIYVITTNENGERIITFKDGSTAILEVSKTDLDDLNKNLKADLNHENVLIDPETGKIDYLAMALNKSAAHESMADLAVNKDGSLNHYCPVKKLPTPLKPLLFKG